MSITILNYHDQAFVDHVSAKAAQRAAAARAALETTTAPASPATLNNDFSNILSQTAQPDTPVSSTDSSVSTPADLNSIFEEAAATYGISANLLKAIAKAESGFNPNAVSHAGAVGIMQLMPTTAASLGVTNSYDPRENIMGGAKLVSQLLTKYNGNLSLALAAYNAGSGNVDKYGGIPPFTETQNYVNKILSSLNGTVTVPSNNSSTFNLTPEAREQANKLLHILFSANGISKRSLDLATAIIKLSQEEQANPSDSHAPANNSIAQNSVTQDVTQGSVLQTEHSNAPADHTEPPADNKTANLLPSDPPLTSELHTAENKTDFQSLYKDVQSSIQSVEETAIDTDQNQEL